MSTAKLGRSVFLEEIEALITSRNQRMFDGHGHLCREGTLKKQYYSHVDVDPFDLATRSSLTAKQYQVGYLHDGIAYQDQEELYKRMRESLERRIGFGIGRFDTCIDTTPDIGLRALDSALRLKEELKEQIDLRLGAYPLWGFKKPDQDPDRLNTFIEASEKADFVCGLPERDDGPDKIGFDEHIRIILQRAIELGKPAHFHVDQANNPNENGIETLINAVRWLGSPIIADSNEPSVWSIHDISSSCKTEETFWKMVENLRKYNIGVICCPRAAISMRQLRSIAAPCHNSIARILEMLYAKVWVRIGSDNVSDVFVPTGCGDLRDEIEIGADILRFYAPTVWYKLALGIQPNESDRDIIRNTLNENYSVYRSSIQEEEEKRKNQLSPWTLPEY